MAFVVLGVGPVSSCQCEFLCDILYIVTGFTVPHTHVTQMVGLYQDPKGKTIFSRTDPSQSTTKFADKKDTIESLRQQVKELKNEVSLTDI